MGKVLIIIKKYIFGVIVITTSVVSVVVSAYMAIQVAAYNKESALQVKENLPPADKSKEGIETIAVDVSGSVKKPGIISLKKGSRLSEALEKGGGLTQEAAKAYVEQSINLSQILVDQQKIYIPTEAELAVENIQRDVELAESNSTDVKNLVNINEASNSKLEELPGIGEATSKKIVDNRPYAAIEDLITKKVISQSALEKIQSLITL